MLLTIDFGSEVPIYAQIRNQIIEGILTGTLKTADSLPSVRQLATDIGVNLHTVNKSYTILKQEGFITVHRQKGAVVNPPESYRANKDYMQSINELIKPMIIESLCRGVSKEDFQLLLDGIYKKYSDTNKEVED